MLGGAEIFPLQKAVSLTMAEHEPSIGASDDMRSGLGWCAAPTVHKQTS
jgi:hypothetical protein